MIAVVYMFGPMHGRTEYLTEPLQGRREIIVPNPPMFQEYRFGEPFGMPRPSMMAERHIYVLYDQIEDGVQEGAIYLHHESCCDQGYEASDDYKQHFRRMEDRPRIVDVPPSIRDKRKGKK